MKFIHTSDWHLGQSFMNKSREREHRAFLTWLLEQIASQSVDALIVAGDIFDSATPPSYARTLYFDFITALKQAGCPQVIIVGGNHDSVAVLNEAKELLKFLNITVIGGAEEELDNEVCLIRNTKQEPVGVVCAVPYLRDRNVRKSVAGESVEQKQQALRQGISGHYSAVYEKAKVSSQKYNDLPIIATGHLTTAGSDLTEGVRKLYVGTLEHYDCSDFPSFDYIALGHLHKKQIMGKNNQIRYCGSPIPLSFMEANFDRTVNLVEVDYGKTPTVTELVVPTTQKLKTIEGSLEEVMTKIADLKFDDLAEDEKIWLEVVIKSTGLDGDLTEKLNTVTEDKPLELLRIKRKLQVKESETSQTQKVQLHQMNPEEVFEIRLASEELDEDKKAQLSTLFQQVYSSVQEAK